MKKIAFFVLCSLLALCGCKSGSSAGESSAGEEPDNANTGSSGFSQFDPPSVGEEYAVIETGFGSIELRLFAEYAPKAVENFITLAKSGYYDGVIFHRVVQGFVIQGGDPLGTGMGGESKWGEGFEIEPNAALRHYNGALAMARNPASTSSNGSQFYIVQNNALEAALTDSFNQMKAHLDEEIEEGSGVTWGDMYPEGVIDNYLALGGTPTLDYGYTVFGQVISGMDVVETIAGMAVDKDAKPLEDVTMIKVEIKEQPLPYSFRPGT